MEQYIIKGGTPLVGEVEIGGAKNAALPILAAAIMTDETVMIDNLPDVNDINVLLDALSGIGASVQRVDRHTVRINGSGVVDVDIEHGHDIGAVFVVDGVLQAFDRGGFDERTVGDLGGFECTCGSLQRGGDERDVDQVFVVVGDVLDNICGHRGIELIGYGDVCHVNGGLFGRFSPDHVAVELVDLFCHDAGDRFDKRNVQIHAGGEDVIGNLPHRDLDTDITGRNDGKGGEDRDDGDDGNECDQNHGTGVFFHEKSFRFIEKI